jgi:3-deoxy-manno-octulosonate cytidylyltransferase (CMP-KDO synthetase)
VKILAVIPARHGASRLPGKPLADLGGRPVIQWVFEAAAACSDFDDVIVATDHDAIATCVEGFGGKVELTSRDHPSGTDRVAEVAERHPDAEVVVNVQGDQPFATPGMLRALVQPYLSGMMPAMTTLACPLVGQEAGSDPNVVKVVCNIEGYALYFSRSLIPHSVAGEAPTLHHLGLYAFSRETVIAYPSLEPTPLERAERLEQLRALEHGISIRVCLTDGAPLEVNTAADLDEARRRVAGESGPSGAGTHG